MLNIEGETWYAYALKYALENEKIRKETNKYIHDTSISALNEYTHLVNQEQVGLTEANERLGDVLVQLSKHDNPSPDQVTMYFETLRLMQINSERLFTLTMCKALLPHCTSRGTAQ